MSLNVEELRESRLKPVVGYEEFINSTGKLPSHLFCFFEGKDNPYYVPRIKKYTSNFHTIICGNRSAVIYIHKLIKNQSVYDKYKKAYFIDRDFNETQTKQNPPIFETPCYSIENLYVSGIVFKQILSNEFNLSETTNTLHQKYLSLYKDRQEEFHNAALLFNCWYACLVKIRNTENKLTGVQLDKKFPKGFIEFTIDKILQNYDFEKMKSTFLFATELDEKILNLKMLEFKNCDASKTFRGKYEMEFLLRFIDLMIVDAKQKHQLNLKLSSVGGAINNEIAIAVFSSYAETPEILDNYLKTILSIK